MTAAVQLVAASCPLCDEPADATFLTRAEVAAELNARHRFFPRGVRDLTKAALGFPAAILRCTHCGVLIRDDAPDESVFRDDRYDDRELELLHATHVQAFAAKERDYRSLLPPRARVVEVGSYAGGFLTAAVQWGWRASGVDIGRDVVRFCRRVGLDVRGSLDARSLDAVFIWNCFEQLAHPAELLAAIHRALRTAGLLVIRVPDAGFTSAIANSTSSRTTVSSAGRIDSATTPRRFGASCRCGKHVTCPPELANELSGHDRQGWMRSDALWGRVHGCVSGPVRGAGNEVSGSDSPGDE